MYFPKYKSISRTVQRQRATKFAEIFTIHAVVNAQTVRLVCFLLQTKETISTFGLSQLKDISLSIERSQTVVDFVKAFVNSF